MSISAFAQSYYARKNLGIGASTGIIELFDKGYNINTIGISFIKHFDFAAGAVKTKKYKFNVYSFSFGINMINEGYKLDTYFNFGYSHIRKIGYSKNYEPLVLGASFLLKPFQSEKYNFYIIPSLSSECYRRDFSPLYLSISLAYGYHINDHITISFEPSMSIPDKAVYSASLGIYIE
jgi:hypothetical protein